MITHYFPTQTELLDEVTVQVLAGWNADIQALDAASDTSLERLRSLLRWLVPLTDVGLRDEQVRIHLIAGQLLGDENRATFNAMDQTIRTLLRSHVADLAPESEVERVVELLRVTTNGVALSVVENPQQWPAARQLAILDWLVESLGLAGTTSVSRSVAAQ
ncbi:hypothetical protein LK09_08010 [Microbacterium mangrovi]|uniref:BetI-type transcriptional repressor C-terminal domain-containing protein n=2 Tax=Microbacterium mangrovi TaxID=1348253 RepID=A0A0B2AAP9_9MICO|nr:hypothetical protein LK09_08010 [Microbacterium mangrovi]